MFKLKSLRVEAAGSFIIKFINALLGLLVAMLLAKTLGTDGYGQYAYVYALITVISIPTKLGIPPLVTRNTSILYKKASYSAVHGLWRFATKVIVCNALVVVALIILYVNIVNYEGAWLLLTASVLLPLISISSLCSAALRGIGQTLLGQLPDQVVRQSVFVVLLFVFYYLGCVEQASPVVAVYLHLIGASASVVFGFLLIRKFMPFERSEISDASLHRFAFLKSAAIFGAAAGMTIINNNVDILMIGVFRTDSEVGIYRSVVLISGLSLIGFQVARIISMHRIAYQHSEGSVDSIQKLTTNVTRLAFVFSLMFAIICILFGELILSKLFNAEFVTGYFALVILLFGNVLNASLGPSAMILSMTNNESSMLKFTVLAVALNIVLNYFLIKRLGFEGAAIATVFSVTFLKLCLFISVKRKVGVNSSIFYFRRTK